MTTDEELVTTSTKLFNEFHRRADPKSASSSFVSNSSESGNWIGTESLIEHSPDVSDITEAIMKSIVDKRLKENMPLFENAIASMINHKLKSMELSPVSNLNLNEIPDDVKAEIIKELSKMDFVKTIAYSKEDSNIRLIIIHSSSDKSEAFDKIAESIFDLEDRIPEFFIEPWILHESETQSSYLEDTKLILNVQ